MNCASRYLNCSLREIDKVAGDNQLAAFVLYSVVFNLICVVFGLVVGFIFVFDYMTAGGDLRLGV